jgi:retron-type reverse transcriptase
MLMDGTYQTSTYKNFTLFDPKEREISGLPYMPDRVAHHAAMFPLEQMFTSSFTTDTYSCIKGKGVHDLKETLERKLRQDVAGTRYCLKMDIRKFYPSIKHDILKNKLRCKIKDIRLLKWLDEVIDSAPGVPIGNYLSQYFANFYLSGLDHWLKEVKKVKYYFRYADDMIILCDNKADLHQLRKDIQEYLRDHLQLELKSNYQVFPVSVTNGRGIDLVGYVFYHTHTILRKTIKQRMVIAMIYGNNPISVAAHMGWAVHCNSLNLIKIINEKIQRIGDQKNHYKLCG